MSVSAGGEDDRAGEGERQREEERSRAAPLRQRQVVKCDQRGSHCAESNPLASVGSAAVPATASVVATSLVTARDVIAVKCS